MAGVVPKRRGLSVYIIYIVHQAGHVGLWRRRPRCSTANEEEEGQQGPPETAKGIIEHRIEGKLQARLLYKEDIVQKNIPGLFDRTCSLLSLEQPRVKEKHCFRC